jgi:hypothetical protein
MTLLYLIFSLVVSKVEPQVGTDIIHSVNHQFHTDMSGFTIFFIGWIIALILDAVFANN